jgi:hypothetical protein
MNFPNDFRSFRYSLLDDKTVNFTKTKMNKHFTNYFDNMNARKFLWSHWMNFN